MCRSLGFLTFLLNLFHFFVLNAALGAQPGEGPGHPNLPGLVGMYSWGLGVLGTSELSFNWGLVVTFLVNFSR